MDDCEPDPRVGEELLPARAEAWARVGWASAV
jgi:hypothetical protein